MSRSYTSSPPSATMACSGTASLLLYAEVSGLSRGKVIVRVFEFRTEMYAFFCVASISSLILLIKPYIATEARILRGHFHEGQ
jgi:hypothetical protein